MKQPRASEIEHLYVNLGRAYELADDWEEARGAYEEMQARGRETGDRRLEWAALNRLAVLIEQHTFDGPAAVKLLERALSIAEASGDRAAVAETEWNLCNMLAPEWKTEAAIEHGRKALELAEELGLKELAARAVLALGHAHMFAGQHQQAAQYCRRAASLCGTLAKEKSEGGTLTAQYVWAGSPPSEPLYLQAMEASSLVQLSFIEVNLGELADAVKDGRAAMRTAREANNKWAGALAGLCLAQALVEAGEYDEAIRVGNEALETARELPNRPLLNLALLTVGFAFQALLRLEEAREVFEEGLDLFEEGHQVRPFLVCNLAHLCANRGLVGDWEAASDLARRELEVLSEAPKGWFVVDLAQRHLEIEALLRSGNEELAREDVGRFGDHARDNRRVRLVHLRMLTVLSRWDDEIEAELAQLREAEALAEKIGLPGELWQIRAQLGELLEGMKEHEEACMALDRAAETVQWITGKIKDEALREGFSSAPQVRRLLDARCED